MMTNKLLFAAASGMALMLSACGDADTVDNTDMAASEMDTGDLTNMDGDMAAVNDFDPMSRDYTLSAEQKTRRDAFDMAAFRTDYDKYRMEMDKDKSMSEMTRDKWEYSALDRNRDGKLSAAEYAFYAAPMGSTKMDDAQLGKLADSYYFYDADGDGYISDSEFTSIRSGSMNDDKTMSDGNMSGDKMGNERPMTGKDKNDPTYGQPQT
ncbi:hypothetical protein [Qipengyuania marisflavi]|uniref:EF-hand domain-containing protein n=1 Tax=Qipengyuania marisflavi TaxID=2486356 RepID=A0A5S3Q133_9SPHN|nr:hypothetical protein [Qipengyuania marisflavi]TMM50057.1 hypothetical protein FEV51_02350 [Qipengyuania marisflavi]